MTESTKLLKLGIKVYKNAQRKFVTDYLADLDLYKFQFFFELSEMELRVSCFLSVYTLHIVNLRTRKVCKIETQ